MIISRPTAAVIISSSHVVVKNNRMSMSGNNNDNDFIWTNLVPDDDNEPVRKRILTKAEATAEAAVLPTSGSTVRIKYDGSLVLASTDDGSGGMPAWTTNDVLECWLKEQQGLYDVLADPFREHSVDGSTLLDEDIFTEAYVSNTLGVANKIQCKKTIMAAKRLRKTLTEFTHGDVFDSSSKPDDQDQEEQWYEFVVGKKKTIRAMELLVSSMAVGETSRLVCRSDYGYGSDGYRTSKGDVVVPPFATLQFDVTLLSVN